MYPQGGEIRGRDQLAPGSLCASALRDSERHWCYISKRGREEIVERPVAQVVRIGRRVLQCDQLVRIGNSGQVAQESVHLAVRAGGDTDTQGQRDQCDGREAWRSGKHAKAIANVPPQFRQMLGRQADPDVQQQTQQSEQAISLPDRLDHLLGHLDQMIATGILELFGKSAGQRAVKPQTDGHRPAGGMIHDSAPLFASPRLLWITRTRSSRRRLSAANTLRPNLVRR